MAKFIVAIEDSIPNDGAVDVRIRIEGIKNESKAVALVNIGKDILADGKVTGFELLQGYLIMDQLGKL